MKRSPGEVVVTIIGGGLLLVFGIWILSIIGPPWA